MKSKTIKYNLLVLLILVSILVILLESLNLVFGGVPIYRQLKIDREFENDVLGYKRKQWEKNNYTNLDSFYIDYFNNYSTDEYIKNIKRKINLLGNYILLGE